MKGRTTLLIFAALLSMGAIANAAAPAPAVAAAPAACGAHMSTLDVPGLAPPASFLSATCGPCSLSPCQNVPLHTGCFISPSQGFGTCQNVYGNFCSTKPLQSQCQCWNRPLP